MRAAARVQSGGGVRVWRVQLSCGSATHAQRVCCCPRILLAYQAHVACAASSQTQPQHLQVVAKCDVKCWQNMCLDNTQAHASSAAGRKWYARTHPVSLRR